MGTLLQIALCIEKKGFAVKLPQTSVKSCHLVIFISIFMPAEMCIKYAPNFATKKCH